MSPASPPRPVPGLPHTATVSSALAVTQGRGRTLLQKKDEEVGSKPAACEPPDTGLGG